MNGGNRMKLREQTSKKIHQLRVKIAESNEELKSLKDTFDK